MTLLRTYIVLAVLRGVATVMAVLLLDYYEGGNVGKTAAFSLVQTVILGVLLGITTWLSRGSAESAGRAG